MAMQLKIPTPTVACTPGMCLVYVQDTFGISAKYPTATAAWNASQYKHQDQDFPANLWVPLWFSLADDPNGHVVLRQPDGTIWSASHPTQTTPIHHASLAELESYYTGRLHYLGWTEDVEDVLVATTQDSGPGQAFSVASRDSSLTVSASAEPRGLTAHSVTSELQRSMPVAGLTGYTGHRPNHPSIEHRRISRQIEMSREKTGRNSIKAPARRTKNS